MTLLRQLSDELAALVARASPAVVGIRHRRGHGSGLALAEDGYVLTNAHVARGARELLVRLSGTEEVKAELVGADARTDLAVLRVHGITRLKTLALAEQRRVRVGELVVAIGNPLGFDRSVTLGTVSALYRDLPTPEGGVLEGLIQTDAAVNPGNSGGPLLDVDGAVVGITTAMIPFAHGMGFAIPAHTASWIAAVLIQRGEVRRPYLGLAARSEELPVGSSDGHARALRILRIESGTPAERSGLQSDDLLLAASGAPIGTVDDVQRVLVLGNAPEISLDVLRGRSRTTIGIRPEFRAHAA
jgi:S1-C subfamily serine protease